MTSRGIKENRPRLAQVQVELSGEVEAGGDARHDVGDKDIVHRANTATPQLRVGITRARTLAPGQLQLSWRGADGHTDVLG